VARFVISSALREKPPSPLFRKQFFSEASKIQPQRPHPALSPSPTPQTYDLSPSLLVMVGPPKPPIFQEQNGKHCILSYVFFLASILILLCFFTYPPPLLWVRSVHRAFLDNLSPHSPPFNPPHPLFLPFLRTPYLQHLFSPHPPKIVSLPPLFRSNLATPFFKFLLSRVRPWPFSETLTLGTGSSDLVSRSIMSPFSVLLRSVVSPSLADPRV